MQVGQNPSSAVFWIQAGRGATHTFRIGQTIKAIVVTPTPAGKASGQAEITAAGQPAKIESSVPLVKGQKLVLEIVSIGNRIQLKVQAGQTNPGQEISRQAIREWLPNQDSHAKLLTLIKQINATNTNLPLPTAVRQQLQALNKSLPKLEQLAQPELLKQAVQRSGVFLEAQLANAPASNQSRADFKAQLLRLLATISGHTTANPHTQTRAGSSNIRLPPTSQTPQLQPPPTGVAVPPGQQAKPGTGALLPAPMSRAQLPKGISARQDGPRRPPSTVSSPSTSDAANATIRRTRARTIHHRPGDAKLPSRQNQILGPANQQTLSRRDRVPASPTPTQRNEQNLLPPTPPGEKPGEEKVASTPSSGSSRPVTGKTETSPNAGSQSIRIETSTAAKGQARSIPLQPPGLHIRPQAQMRHPEIPLPTREVAMLELEDAANKSLARIGLHQITNIQKASDNVFSILLEIPVRHRESADIIHFRFGSQGGKESGMEEKWHTEFAVDLPELGPLNVLLSLDKNRRLRIVAAAERANTRQLFQQNISELKARLDPHGIELTDLSCHALQQESKTPAGNPHEQLLDTRA